ncbi:hypothetical protein EVAR_42571_1 [Eumeta japonica]|uniref:Uncharacterized protein n=1 Tax=Eumeta variegata TaxID=151549 RepID=A0A4C1WRF0_EUMVA|nr:hypothetical protein EVAR_42571_1 [Eumeta japonica]
MDISKEIKLGDERPERWADGRRSPALLYRVTGGRQSRRGCQINAKDEFNILMKYMSALSVTMVFCFCKPLRVQEERARALKSSDPGQCLFSLNRERGGGSGRGGLARRLRECGVLSENVNMDDDILFLIENSYVKWKMTKIRIGVHEINQERERYGE